jgi:hypothetical protein
MQLLFAIFLLTHIHSFACCCFTLNVARKKGFWIIFAFGIFGVFKYNLTLTLYSIILLSAVWDGDGKDKYFSQTENFTCGTKKNNNLCERGNNNQKERNCQSTERGKKV